MDTDDRELITKAIAGLVVLRDATLQGLAEDDRPPRARPFFPRLNAAAAAIIDRYASRNPRHSTIADAESAGQPGSEA